MKKTKRNDVSNKFQKESRRRQVKALEMLAGTAHKDHKGEVDEMHFLNTLNGSLPIKKLEEYLHKEDPSRAPGLNALFQQMIQVSQSEDAESDDDSDSSDMEGEMDEEESDNTF